MPEPDAVLNRTETELDRLDPPPRPPRPPRRRIGETEAGVRLTLRELPAVMRKGGIAAIALRLARELDSDELSARDAAGHGREIRQCLTTLADMAPGERKGDETDEVRARRERRLAAAAGE